MHGYPLVYNDGKVIGSDDDIKLGLSAGKVLGTIFGNVDVITLGFDVVIELGVLDGSFDGSNDGRREGLFICTSMVFCYLL